MRVTPLVGTKVWFGPRRLGWGWDPVSWEGWATLAAATGASFAIGALWDGSPWVAVAVLALGVLGPCVLKGTPPGGPLAAERFEVIRRNARRTPEMQERDRRLRQVLEDEPSVSEAAERLRDVPRRPRRS